VQLPLEQIGSRAVDLLVEQIENGQPEEQIIVLPAKLRAGVSTAPCRV
jgi:DNA-binding LacI/PurR family transcriptional regulator